MPSSYAHYRFGKQLLPELPADVRQCIQRFRRMYDTGLQGPDFFFYYNPFTKSAATELGRAFHRQTGQEFFTRACAAADSEAARAYLYGLLGHYCLDSACHPFVHQKVQSGEAKHVALESEFDRYLMAADGIPAPHSHDMSRLLKLTRGECMTVAGFYPTATGSQVDQGVKRMALFLRLLAHKNRPLVRRVLRGKPALLEHLIPEEPVEEYARMDSELLARYNRALKRYPALLAQLQNHSKTGEPLDEAFGPTFG